jgi:hypothetical protein
MQGRRSTWIFWMRILRALIFLAGAGCRFECKTVLEAGRLGGCLSGVVHCSGPPRLFFGKRLRPAGQLMGLRGDFGRFWRDFAGF